MTIGLPPYPESKDSGLLWLGRIPAHWGICASKRMFTESAERAHPDDEQLSAAQSHGVILQREYERLVGRKVVRILHHLDKRKHVERDDFVISMRSFQGGLERAFARGAIRSSYVVLKPAQGVYVPYFAHLFKSQPYIESLRATSQFIRDGQDLTFANFCEVALPVVPLDEQKAIADYLDAQSAKIRRFIRNRRRLIEVLSEQKQAIINRAVTRGLDPRVPLKPSGINWLGDIPEHWEVVKIKRIARIDPPRSESLERRNSDEQVMFVPMDRISIDGQLDESERRPIREVWQGFTYFRRGDVVVAKITPCFENGKGACLTALETDIGFGTTELIVLRPSPAVSPKFLYQLTMLAEFRRRGVESMTGAAGQQRVSPEFVANFMVPLPPRHEQEKIVAFVAGEGLRYRRLIDRARREIDLIREYRTRLIADVVTGKVDVRHLAPAELSADEPDAEDADAGDGGEELRDEETAAAEEAAED